MGLCEGITPSGKRKIINVTEDGNLNLSLSSPTEESPEQINPGLQVYTNSDTIPAGKYSVSVQNIGSANGTFLGAILKPGEGASFTAPDGKILGPIAYNAVGTSFLMGIM